MFSLKKPFGVECEHGRFETRAYLELETQALREWLTARRRYAAILIPVVLEVH